MSGQQPPAQPTTLPLPHSPLLSPALAKPLSAIQQQIAAHSASASNSRHHSLGHGVYHPHAATYQRNLAPVPSPAEVAAAAIAAAKRRDEVAAAQAWNPSHPSLPLRGPYAGGHSHGPRSMARMTAPTNSLQTLSFPAHPHPAQPARAYAPPLNLSPFASTSTHNQSQSVPTSPRRPNTSSLPPSANINTVTDNGSQSQSQLADNESLLEAEHFTDIIYHMEMYATHTFAKFDRLCRDFRSIDPALMRLVPGWDTKMNEIRQCILVNHDFIRQVTSLRHVFQQDDTINYDFLERARLRRGSQSVDEEKMGKVRSTLRQCVRDWSTDGEKERSQCYTPILRELDRLFPATTVHRGNIRVLVPGSGLARLTWEVANAGFFSQGNEFSYFMLVTCFLILNHCQQPHQWTLHPYIHECKNVMRTDDMLRKVTIPDVDVSSLSGDGRFSMVAGDFMDVYSEEGREYRSRERSMQDTSYKQAEVSPSSQSQSQRSPIQQSPVSQHESQQAQSPSSANSPIAATVEPAAAYATAAVADSADNDASSPASSPSSTAQPQSKIPSLSSQPQQQSPAAVSPTNGQPIMQHPALFADDAAMSGSDSEDEDGNGEGSTAHQRESWDCVCTCYFLDCANNILEFVRTISYLLKPGGYWINFGPLLYHFSDTANELSIELSYEELKATFPAFGLKLTAEKTNRQSGYAVDERSMMRTYYYSVEFTCQKVAPDSTRFDRPGHFLSAMNLGRKKTRRGKGRKARMKAERERERATVMDLNGVAGASGTTEA